MTSCDNEAVPAWFRRLTVHERGLFVLAAAGALGLLLLGLCLTPDPRGLGTHEQLGLPPCATQWLFGIPCPFCGMTTAFSLVSRGRLVDGFVTQPAGAMLAVACAGAGLASMAGAVSGYWPASRFRLAERRWAIAAGGFILAAAWLYRIAVVFLR